MDGGADSTERTTVVGFTIDNCAILPDLNALRRSAVKTRIQRIMLRQQHSTGSSFSGGGDGDEDNPGIRNEMQQEQYQQQQQELFMCPMYLPPQPQRGVLWKRRDVFRNNWRPRWFDLQPEQGLLTYYLLTGGGGGVSTGGTAASSTIPNVGDAAFQTPPPISLLRSSSNDVATVTSYRSRLTDSSTAPLVSGPTVSHDKLRLRATSWDSATSNVSENSVDYDVVPRGSIYLWGGGCSVFTNENLSKPQENLFAFTIRPSDSILEPGSSSGSSSSIEINPTDIHLAARTPELRDTWVRKLNEVCRFCQPECYRTDDKDTTSNNGYDSNTRIVPFTSPKSESIKKSVSTSSRLRSYSANRLNHPDSFLRAQEPILEETHADIYNHCVTYGDDSTSSHVDGFITPFKSLPPTSPQQPGTILSKSQDNPEICTMASKHSKEQRSHYEWNFGDVDNEKSLVYSMVPKSIFQQIRDKLCKCLVILDDDTKKEIVNSDSVDSTYLTQPPLPGTFAWKNIHMQKKHELKNLNFVAYQCQHDWESILPENMVNSSKDDTKKLIPKENNDITKLRTIVKSEVTIAFPPKHVFNLIIDISRRKEYEANVQSFERIQRFNSHTTIDYYASSAIWPTAAREFVVACHWQVLTRNDGQKAIAIISFSCPEAEALRTIAPNHVRAKLFVSMYLLRDIGDDKCHMTRILSLDLAGNLSQQLSTVVMNQQARVPAIIADHLQKIGLSSDANKLRTSEPLSNEDVIRNVIERVLKNETISKSELQSTKDSSKASTNGTGPDDEDFRITTHSNMRRSSQAEIMDPKTKQCLALQAILLLTPVLVHRLCVLLWMRSVAVPVFCFLAIAAVRQVVLIQIRGESIHVPSTVVARSNLIHGSVKLQFSVDLKGILRFISNKKEEREAMKETVENCADVSVVHIVAAALARALKREHELNFRRLTIPWLLIDELVEAPSSDPVNVSIWDTIMTKSRGLVTVKYADRLDVQSIANRLTRQNSSVMTNNHMKDVAQDKINSCKSSGTTKQEYLPEELGQCIVLSNPDGDGCDADDEKDSTAVSIMDILPVTGSGITVVAVLGDVRLERRMMMVPSGGKPMHNSSNSRMTSLSGGSNGVFHTPQSSSVSGAVSPYPPPRPVLSLSITIVPGLNSHLLDIQVCRRYVEEVRKLLLFPEMCDND